MKALITLLIFFMVLDAIAVAPYGFRGQNQTATQYSNVLQFPNNQVTNIGGINSLVETGNTNILVNPGFEHSTFSTGWTTTGTTATLTAETVTIIHGKKALETVASSQNISIVQDSTLYASQLAGVQGFVKAWISNTAPSVSMCARAAGVTLTGNNCVTLATDGRWKEYVIPVVLSATSNGISIAATSVTGTTIIDEAFVGVVPNAMPEVSQPQLVGSAHIQGTALCQWQRTNTAPGAFGAVAACPGPTSILAGAFGAVQTTDTDLPRFTWNNLPPGRYVVTMEVPTNNGAAAVSALAISDGTTTSKPRIATENNGITQGITLTTAFEYTSAGSRTWELFGAQSSGTLRINNNTTSPDNGLSILVTYYPPASKVYSQGCADPRQCENTFTAKLSSTGVVSAENLDWINGNCVQATGLKTCTLNTSALGITTGMVCTYTANANTHIPIVQTSNSTTVAVENANTSGVTTAGAGELRCTKASADYKPQDMITGTFANVVTAPSTPKPLLGSAEVSTTGGVSKEFGDLFTTCTNANPMVCTFARTYTNAPNCSVTNSDTGTANCTCGYDSVSTTAINLRCITTAAAACTQTIKKSVICIGD